MRDFARRYRFSLDDPDLRRMYEYELSAKRDQASREYYAKEEGRAEGRAEGITKVIRGMLRNGMPTEIIYNCVGESREEVDAIIAKIRSGELHG